MLYTLFHIPYTLHQTPSTRFPLPLSLDPYTFWTPNTQRPSDSVYRCTCLELAPMGKQSCILISPQQCTGARDWGQSPWVNSHASSSVRSSVPVHVIGNSPYG